MAATIHPTAVIDPSARIGEGAEIGPHAVIAGDVVIGDGCRLMAFSVIGRHTTLAARNTLHPFVALGGEPQEADFDPRQWSGVRIGSGNVFREGVTVYRAVGEGATTVIGDDGYFMTAVHVGPNATVGSGCIVTNGSLLGRHSELGDRAVISANTSVRPYCRVGRMAMVQGNAEVTAHMPPYCMFAKGKWIVGLNVVGLRRARHITDADREQIVAAYKLTYRTGLSAAEALAAMDAHTDWGAAAGEFRQFVRRALSAEEPYPRGIAASEAQAPAGGSPCRNTG